MSARVSPARRAAFETLQRVENDAAYASNILAADRVHDLSREDRALEYELVLGVLRWQGQLDYLIAHYARRPLTKLDAAVVIALRLGLYQLRFLTRIPAHAAINEAVNQVRERRLASAAPFVNAVLRAAAREAEREINELTGSLPDPVDRSSIEISLPHWLLARWATRFGTATGLDEAKALALAFNATPRTAFRFNPRRAAPEETRAWLDAQKIAIRNSTLVPGAVVLEQGHLSPDAEPVHKGWLYFQDEASQLVAHLAVDRQRDETSRLSFLDLCAAPGSKTTLVASLLPDHAVLVASDLHLHRLRTMKGLAARLGIEHLHLVQLDASQKLPFHLSPGFDCVLLDAPCSGLGTLARHPEIKWRMSEEKLRELAAMQRRLIAQAAAAVRPGGLLVYAVCSTEPEEGEEVVAWLRDGHREFRDMTRERLVELGLDPAQLLTSTHGARTFTDRHGAESFFFCVLWKRK
jgi:16S rRNA (cytosine967-C5)-methyltransferase